MSSFLNRLKSPTGTSNGATPAKKDLSAPQPTPLERILSDLGPLRADGSDKFFGFENFGSTCYCNSIIQCLYYSAPFREQVINFPIRTPIDSLRVISADQSSNVEKGRALFSPPTSPQRVKPPTPGVPPSVVMTKEENKDSPEYKKKLALATGPVIMMDYENSNNYGMSESLFSCLKDIFEAIIAHGSRTGVVSPHKFLEILRREHEMFRTPMHQDAHEFLNLVLNEVVENVEQFAKQSENSTTTDGSESERSDSPFSSAAKSSQLAKRKASTLSTRWVHELFEGVLTSETRCLTCENTSSRDEEFLDLSVDLEQHSSVTSCLRKFSEEEMLCERNKFHCDKCGGLQEAEKRMKIKRLPRVLALHLKRFKYTEDLQRLQKLFHRVVYPYYLRLFNTTDDAEDPDRLYELYAVVVHIGGGPYHGHYISIIKTQDRGWLLFDDENVEPVDKSFVRNYFGGDQNLACAYVLFYQETTVEAMQREQESECLVPTPQHLNVNATAKEMVAKANGILTNGNNVHTHAPSTPISEDVETFRSLDQAPSAPAIIPLPQSPSAFPLSNPLEQVATSPMLPFLHRKKSKLPIEKDQQELSRTAAANSTEKTNGRQNEVNAQSKPDSMNRHPVIDGAGPIQPRNSMTGANRSNNDLQNHLTQKRGPSGEHRRLSGPGKEHYHSSGDMFGRGMQLLRNTSFNIKSKKGLWSKSHKADHYNHRGSPSPQPDKGISTMPPSSSKSALPPGFMTVEYSQTAEPTFAPIPYTPGSTSTMTDSEKAKEKEKEKEKRKGLFYVGRKKSVNNLL